VPKLDHIPDLERRYKSLEAEISAALIHNPIDDLMIIDLKRRLLHLRDEIFRQQFEEEVEEDRPTNNH
jgi:hypothetical protein